MTDFLIFVQEVIPATIGVIKGQLTVGLSDEEIETLGSFAQPGNSMTGAKGKFPVVKVSRRDLPFALSQVRPNFIYY